MQKDEIRTIRFAAIVCLVCSITLAGVQGALRGKQRYNKRIDEQINVLKALAPDFSPDGAELTDERRDEYFTVGKVPKEWISKYFDQYIEKTEVELPKGKTGTLYTLKNPEGEVASYGFPAEGKGLWSTVHSYVGLQPDLATIRGITFFDHGETPGLGGECSKPWFQRNFEGKKLWRDGQPVKLEVAKGDAPEPEPRTMVDGMSGATITGNGIERFVNDTFRAYNQAVFQEKRAI